MKQVLLPLMRIGIFAFACLHFSCKVANAQVTADDTVNTQVNQTDNVSEITGGETRGDNLFHSFQEFSVGAGNEAFFNNAEAIANIFSRVTGGDISNINGLISANGSANLFLINPAGITFGEGASLNIGGSFYGSTADSILFEDGEFSATDLENSPVLTINAPIGLGFRDNPQDVINQSGGFDSTGQFISGLQVLEGKSLALIGGDVRFDSGYISAPGGRVELGGLSATGTIGFNDDGSFSFPDGIARGDVFLNQEALVAVSGAEGGNLTVNTNNLEISDNSSLLGGTFADTGIADGQSGDIVVDATGKIEIKTSTISNVVQTGNGGDIQITANSLSLDNSAIDNSTEGSGNAGNLEINASDSVNLSGDGILIDVTVNEAATGNGGNASINTETLTLTDGAQISASTFGSGDGGSLSITANQSLSLNGSGSAIGSQVEPNAVGDAGDVAINTGNLTLADGAFLSTATLGEGNAGRLDIRSNSLTVNASQIRAEVGAGLTDNNESQQATGKGGIINIDTETLDVINGGQIVISTFGEGDAGNLEINASDSVNLSGDGILIDVTVNEGATGTGGNASINTETLTLTDGAQISASTFGSGDGGSLSITANQSLSLNGSGSAIGSQVEPGAVGDAGDVAINTGNFTLADGAFLSTATLSEGNAGRLDITSNSLTLNASKIRAEVGVSLTNNNESQQGTGQGGIINIDTEILDVTNGGQIVTSTFGEGDAGKLTVNADDIVFAGVNEDGTFSGITSIVETGATGNAGGINITTGSLTITDGAQLASSTFGAGNAGNITVNASDTVFFEGTNSQGKPSAAFSNVEAGAIGDGGEIEITADSLSLLDGGQLNAFVVAKSDTASAGQGDAGKVTLNIRDATTLAGVSKNGISSGIFSNVQTGAIGNAGGIDIRTGNLAVSDGALLVSGTFGAGNAGNITVKADSLTLDNNAEITSSSIPSEAFSEFSTEAQKGGNVTINFQNVLKLSGGSVVDAKATGESNGGNITINAPDGFIVAFPNQNNDITANAEQGAGGKINIAAESVFGIEERELNDRTNDINASSDVLGLDGTVNLNTSDINPLQGATELPSNVVETRQTTEQTCSVDRQTGTASGLTVQGRGGVQPSPDLPLSSQTILDNGKNIATESNEAQVSVIAPIHTSQGDIIPAQGIIRTEDGRILLTAYRTDGNSRLPQGAANCTK
jgi:filamentous hemagglutinin family protein